MLNNSGITGYSRPRDSRGDMGKLVVIVGGQYGSEGKGAVAALLTARYAVGNDVLCVRVGGPNAGHTVVDPQGNKWPFQQLPCGTLVPGVRLAVAAGSEIDPTLLEKECARADQEGYEASLRLTIDRSATILEERHSLQETAGQAHGEAGLTARIGSTGKGVGAARADRIMRNAEIWGGWSDVSRLAAGTLSNNGVVIVEGTQGYGLGLHGDHYPHCTSGDCRAIDFLAQSGISPWQPGVDELEIWVVARTFPIRVAGNSGDLKDEITWDEIGVPPEQTTVTHKTRRVGRFDPEMLAEAVRANGGGKSDGSVRIALTMADYWWKELAQTDAAPWWKGADRFEAHMSHQMRSRLRDVEDAAGAPIRLVGISPTQLLSRGWW